jgi:hypothetical protein
MSGRRGTPQERFWAKVDKSGEECWLWTAHLDKDGYGFFRIGGKGSRNLRAHRVSYEWARGPIPETLQLDHLCRTPSCVNPEHLEPVTGRENVLRGETFAATNAQKTHCPLGHPYDLFNTYEYKGMRTCRACRRLKRRTPESIEYHRRWKAARRERVAGPNYYVR